MGLRDADTVRVPVADTADFVGVRVPVAERVPVLDAVAERVAVRDAVGVWLGGGTLVGARECDGVAGGDLELEAVDGGVRVLECVANGVGARINALTGAVTTPRKTAPVGAEASAVVAPVAVTYAHSVVADTAYTTKDACAAS